MQSKANVIQNLIMLRNMLTEKNAKARIVEIDQDNLYQIELQRLMNDLFRDIDLNVEQKYTQFLLDDCSSDLTMANGGVNFGKIKGIQSGDKRNYKEILLGGMVPKNSKALAVTKMHYNTKFKVIAHAWYLDHSFLRLKADGMKVYISQKPNKNYDKIIKIPSIPSSN